MRVAWSALGPAASAFAPASASAPAQIVARTACATRLGVADVRQALCVIGFSIPFFICTSTRVSCGFDLGCEYTQPTSVQVMSHPNDVGVSRQYRRLIPDLYPELDSRTVFARRAQRNGYG